MQQTICVFCRVTATEGQRRGYDSNINCSVCGHYVLSGTVEAILEKQPLDDQERAIVSGYLTENPNTTVTSYLLDDVRQKRPAPSDKSRKLLAWIVRQSTHPGAPVVIRLDDRKAMAAGWLTNGDELKWHIEQSLSLGMNAIQYQKSEDGQTYTCTVTASGYREAEKQPLGFRGSGPSPRQV